jgi:hypothetical protein
VAEGQEGGGGVSEINRYRFEKAGMCDCDHYLDEYDGEWCEWNDVKPILDQLADLDRLRGELESYKKDLTVQKMLFIGADNATKMLRTERDRLRGELEQAEAREAVYRLYFEEILDLGKDSQDITGSQKVQAMKDIARRALKSPAPDRCAKIEQLEAVAQDVYRWLKEQNLHNTGHGRCLEQILNELGGDGDDSTTAR